MVDLLITLGIIIQTLSLLSLNLTNLGFHFFIGSSCIDARDAERRTPLHSASWRGQAAVVRLLLSKGADPNAQCDQGATPLGIFASSVHWLEYG